MELLEQMTRANMERINALYEPIYKWCAHFEKPIQPDEPRFDFDGEFYRALNLIVRRPDFRVEELKTVLGLHYTSTLEESGCGDYFDELIARATAVREFVMAVGEVP